MRGVTVAVVDTGVMADHPDLSGQVLTGAHFLHSDDGEPGRSGDRRHRGLEADTAPTSAGTIAAKSNNATGIAGAAPGTHILPVKVLCADGGGFTSDVAEGITWAVDAGADVINLSLGGAADTGEQAAIEYARDHNVVVAAAGGNDGTGGPASYPAAYSTGYANVIAVAATDNANGHPAYGTTGELPRRLRTGRRLGVRLRQQPGRRDPVDVERRQLLHDRGDVDGDAARVCRRRAAPRCERHLHRRAGEEPAEDDGGGPRDAGG